MCKQQQEEDLDHGRVLLTESTLCQLDIVFYFFIEFIGVTLVDKSM